MTDMRIGKLARHTGVSIRALRYYEEKGLLHPDRTPAGYRVFAHADVATVAHIRTLLAAGLNTDLIAEILSCMTDGSRLLQGCRERLTAERRRMSQDIDRLLTARSLLDELLG